APPEPRQLLRRIPLQGDPLLALPPAHDRRLAPAVLPPDPPRVQERAALRPALVTRRRSAGTCYPACPHERSSLGEPGGLGFQRGRVVAPAAGRRRRAGAGAGGPRLPGGQDTRR